jgi:acetylcholinesterase
VQGLAFPPAPIAASENCLFIDVYTPTNATATSQLPVMLWIQGGAFVQLLNPNYNGTGLVQTSGGNVVIVSFNYRVGPYGFLASKELQEENNLNVGLHDQRAAISWVQKHIEKFGGDPGRVTLFGTSIGGGSVLLQTLAYGGNPPPRDSARWSMGIAQAVNIPSIYQVQDLEFQYTELLNATNCTSLACLRLVVPANFRLQILVNLGPACQPFHSFQIGLLSTVYSSQVIPRRC